MANQFDIDVFLNVLKGVHDLSDEEVLELSPDKSY